MEDVSNPNDEAPIRERETESSRTDRHSSSVMLNTPIEAEKEKSS